MNQNSSRVEISWKFLVFWNTINEMNVINSRMSVSKMWWYMIVINLDFIIINSDFITIKLFYRYIILMVNL